MKRTELKALMDSALSDTLKECKEDNPIILWAVFISRLDAAGRRRIGDELEKNGRNRYTGQPVKAPAPAQTESSDQSDCEQCWCGSCANFDDCVVDNPDFDPESEPCPCDGCFKGKIYAPKTDAPPCGNYSPRE